MTPDLLQGRLHADHLPRATHAAPGAAVRGRAPPRDPGAPLRVRERGDGRRLAAPRGPPRAAAALGNRALRGDRGDGGFPRDVRSHAAHGAGPGRAPRPRPRLRGRDGVPHRRDVSLLAGAARPDAEGLVARGRVARRVRAARAGDARQERPRHGRHGAHGPARADGVLRAREPGPERARRDEHVPADRRSRPSPRSWARAS